MQDNDSVAEIVRRAEANYTQGSTTISKYVDFDMYETINKIDAYLNSKHISGSEDSLGREKPFFNIVTAARNIWFRATDIDRKNIRLKATKSSEYLLAFVATMKLQDWMRRQGFGSFLNEWGRTLATYGSCVLKFVKKKGELKPSVIPWNRLIVDPIEFENNVVIEVLEFTPAQLKKQGYDEEVVKSLLETAASREQLDGQKKDTKAEYIKCYEVHGELPLSLLTDNDKQDDTYVQQMHVVSFIGKKEGGKTKYEDFTLYKGREKKTPFMVTHLIKEDGRTLAIGAIENLFEAQWMNNHSMKLIKDQLDLASQLIFQTADGSFVGRNVLTQVMSGDILIHEADRPLTQLNNHTHDITALQNFSVQWQGIGKEITSTPDALRGETQPAGTAWRQVEALRVESHSLFEIMTENKGLDIERMLREYVIPDGIIPEMDTADEITAVLDSHGIAQFDAMYVPNEANRRRNTKIKEQVLAGEIAEDFDTAELEGDIRKEVATLGNQRFIKPSDIPDKTWKMILKDFEWEPEVEVTNESTEKEAILTTLNTVLQTIARNPMILQDPAARSVFVKILEQTGAVSAIEIPPIQPMQQQQQPVGGGSNAAQQQQINPIGVPA